MAVESNTYNDHAIAAVEAYPLISNFSFWLKPQLGADIFDINPMDTEWGDFMKMGLMKEVKGEEIFHHEGNSLFDVPVVNSHATVGNVYGIQSGGDFNGYNYIVLAAESHSPQSGPKALMFSYPRQGQHVLFKNNSEWRIAGVDKSTAGAHKLFLQKVAGTMAELSATITNSGGTYGGDRFIIPSNSWEEATLGQQTGLVPAPKTHTSWLQTFTERYEVTDLSEGNETYPYNWKGKTINYTYERGIADTEVRMAAYIDNGLFLQNKEDGNLSNIDPETGEARSVYTTQGYIQNLEQNAQKIYYDTTPSVGLFRQIGRFRRAMKQGGSVMMWVGSEVAYIMEDFVSSIGVNGAIVYNRTNIDLGISTVKTGNTTYNIKPLNVLDHPDFGGAPGFPYPKYFIVAPMDKINDAKTNIPRNAFQILYKKATGVGARGHYKIWEVGANSRSGSGVNERANRVIKMYVHMGMQVVAASRHILGKPVTP